MQLNIFIARFSRGLIGFWLISKIKYHFVIMAIEMKAKQNH